MRAIEALSTPLDPSDLPLSPRLRRYFKQCSNPHVKVEDWLFTGTYWDERLDSSLDIF